MLLSLVPAMGVTASAAGTEIKAVSFTYTGYAEGENVADAVVTCDTAGVDFTYKWEYLNSGASYSDATKLSAQFISGIEYTLWIYFKAQDGLALAELNETDVTLGGNNPVVVYTNYTIDEVKYSYGVPFSMSPLGGVTKYIVGFHTQGGKIGEESYRVELITGTDGKLTAEQVPTPTKEHYTFDGWYTAESGGTLLSLDTVYTDSSSKYYARWTENPALTGTATITGTAKFGQTLTASLESGNNTGTLSYQWKRDGSDISGAMNSTYTLVKADIGSTITVEISSSEETGTLTSAATAAVKKADSPGAPTGLNGVNPTTLGGSDGKITGTTTAMEYSTDSNFASPAGTVCSGTEITGLTAGTYYVRIAETDTHFAGATATVTVPADDVPLTYTATVTPDGKTFAARTVGYGEQTAETFTITNTGTGALASLDVTLTGANADSFTLDKTGFNTNLATSGTTTFTIKPNTGLAAGTYTATVRVTATNLTTIDKTIRFTVNSSGGGGGGGGGGTSRYTVSFESNGGSKVSNQTVTRNSVMKEPTAPTKENFDFDGWYSDKELKTEYDFSEKVTKSFRLYAKWTEKDDSVNQIILTIGEKAAQVFGKTKSNDVAPKIVNNRTMLPARFVAENLGAKVEWDGEKQLVTITGKNLKTDENVTILITIGAATAKVNGKDVKLDSPAFIENDRTYTPVRFISEYLGASVEWLEKEQKVIITKPEIKKAETK